MYTCRICRFDFLSDDMAVGTEGNGLVCLACYTRETDTHKTMPKPLRKEIEATIASITFVG